MTGVASIENLQVTARRTIAIITVPVYVLLASVMLIAHLMDGMSLGKKSKQKRSLVKMPTF